MSLSRLVSFATDGVLLSADIWRMDMAGFMSQGRSAPITTRTGVLGSAAYWADGLRMQFQPKYQSLPFANALLLERPRSGISATQTSRRTGTLHSYAEVPDKPIPRPSSSLRYHRRVRPRVRQQV